MDTELIIGFKCVNDQMENLFKQIIDYNTEDTRDNKPLQAGRESWNLIYSRNISPGASQSGKQ